MADKFGSLPAELQVAILSYLPASALVAASQVSRELQGLVTGTSELQRKLFLQPPLEQDAANNYYRVDTRAATVAKCPRPPQTKNGFTGHIDRWIHVVQDIELNPIFFPNGALMRGGITLLCHTVWGLFAEIRLPRSLVTHGPGGAHNIHEDMLLTSPPIDTACIVVDRELGGEKRMTFDIIRSESLKLRHVAETLQAYGLLSEYHLHSFEILWFETLMLSNQDRDEIARAGIKHYR